MLCLSLRSSNHPRSVSLDTRTIPAYTAATAAFYASRFNAAEILYEKALQRSRELHDERFEARCLFGKANCRASQLEYGASVPLYLRAKSLAESQHDSPTAAMIALTLSNVFGRMADSETASRYLREAAAIPMEALDAGGRVRVAINAAIGCSVRQPSGACDTEYVRAVNYGIDGGDLRLLAYCYRMFGNHLLRQLRFDEAERNLNQALRLHLMTKGSDITFSYTSLAQLHLAKHHAQLAFAMAARALATAGADVQSPRQIIYRVRALARMELNDVRGALSDFERALEYGRNWRAAVVPTDSARTGSSVWLQDIYSDYIAAGMRMYSTTRDDSLAWNLFQAAEENRAVSFRQKLLSQAKLGPQYWETLARLNNAERASEQNQSGTREAILNSLRLQLSEMEAQAGVIRDPPVPYPHANVENISSDKSLIRFRKFLRPEEALLSFHVGEKESYLWALTPKTFEVHIVPGRVAIASAVNRFRASLQGGDGDTNRIGSELYETLFHGITPAVRRSSSWMLVLDDALFQTPFAALVDAQARRPQFLIEQHAIRILPSSSIFCPHHRCLGIRADRRRVGRYWPLGIRSSTPRTRDGPGRSRRAPEAFLCSFTRLLRRRSNLW